MDVEVTAAPINFRNKLSSMVIFRDITERKRAEEALAGSEVKFRWLYENAPTAYHILTPGGVITDVNHRWCELLGYNKEDVIGKTLFDFVVEEQRQAAQSLV